MSGYAGVFHLDGAPVDRAWLETMAKFLAFRGPDGTQVQVAGSAGMCHTLLRTRAETDGRPQIASLDGCTWITGHVRIDDRETLIAKLPGAAHDLKTACGVELVLHAYAVWGEDCVDHLLGDFSFVIWDGRRKRVFGARDHLGVKPFFYALVGQCLLISNTLDCIRQIAIVPGELNDQAIGEHLIGLGSDPTATFFAAIKRLPVANRLFAGADGLRTERYWTPPIDEPLFYKRSSDYVDRFLDLLRTSVRDRLPDGPLGILLSGGLDSPALAVAAIQLGAKPIGFTAVYDRLIPDQERHYAGLVAQHLGMPIHYIVKDDQPFGWEPGSPPIHTPEPPGDPFTISATRQCFRDMSAHSRVFLNGFGPDAAMQYEWRSYFDWLIDQRRWGRLCLGMITDFAVSPRIPFLQRLPRMWREKSRPDWFIPSFPDWLNPEFEARLKLRDLWENPQNEKPSPHPIRGGAYASFNVEFPFDEGCDAGFTGSALEIVYPFVDLRILRFLLAVPVIPWCRNKYLLRKALRGLIPEAVRRRPKSPVPGFPEYERTRNCEEPLLPPLPPLASYVNLDKLPIWPCPNREEYDCLVRVASLKYWLLSLDPIRSTTMETSIARH